MPSFDVVSKIDKHELLNAVDQAGREIKNRFDFKDSNAKFELVGDEVQLTAPNKFQLQQMQQILEPRLTKRGISLSCLEKGAVQESLHEAKQTIKFKYGIDHELGKRLNKLIKESDLKVQASLMGDHLRVTGKKKDELQLVITRLQAEDFGVPLQFENFRD